MKKILVFASGTKDGGGSGFQELVENSRTGILNADIIAVVSNHENGGVKQKADKLKIPFIYFPAPWRIEQYQKLVDDTKPNLISLSGWLKLALGLDPDKTINIHPGPLPRFGGAGMYGHYVHEAVLAAFQKGEVKCSAVTMHFVTKKFDEGPIFFEYPVLIRKDDTAETLGARVNKIEHGWQSWVTNLVVQELITWDGKNPESLKVPEWYRFHNCKR